MAVPVFDSPLDCTAWVIGGIWPAELSRITAETDAVADHPRDDLQRIARSANDEVKVIRRKGMSDSVRQSEATRVIEHARARAVRRVESTLRHVETATMPPETSPPAAGDVAGIDMGKTQVMPAVKDDRVGIDMETTQIIPAVKDVQTINDSTPVTSDQAEQPPTEDADFTAQGRAKHRRADRP
jgi:hypothetical protein